MKYTNIVHSARTKALTAFVKSSNIPENSCLIFDLYCRLVYCLKTPIDKQLDLEPEPELVNSASLSF